jgi:hypothetical protein
MRKASSLTLRTVKSLYPRADLDTVGEGFAASNKEEADDLVQSFIEIATQVIRMIPVDVVLGFSIDFATYDFFCNLIAQL